MAKSWQFYQILTRFHKQNGLLVPNKTPEIVAAVDLGSNSFHMIVCSLKEGKLQTIDRLKETVRLASGLDQNDMLDSNTQERALACLEKFAQRIRHFPLESVRIVGTNTLRTAKNAQQFLGQAEQILNHPIHIISGIEEARLIYLGVAKRNIKLCRAIFSTIRTPRKPKILIFIMNG